MNEKLIEKALDVRECEEFELTLQHTVNVVAFILIQKQEVVIGVEEFLRM